MIKTAPLQGSLLQTGASPRVTSQAALPGRAPGAEQERASRSSSLPNSTVVFLLALLLTASGLVAPSVALLGGIAYGLAVVHPMRREASSLSRLLLQISVVLLGFGMNLHQVLQVGRSGFLYTAVSIATAVILGLCLGKVLRIGGKASFLITMGTAICGGSAIAALAPVTEANEEEISISMGTIFVLNSLALLIFPPIGWKLHLNQNQFGLWAALAIHDTSSVVGAAARYGSAALAIGTTVKLTRALWIIPVSFLTAVFVCRTAAEKAPSAQKKGVKTPWFIFLFFLASLASTLLARFAPFYAVLNHLGKSGLTATLFLIGTTLSKETLKQVGVRPLLQGVLLWVLVGCGSLAAIYFHVISV